jgi:alpha-tubulin suppressor-like RCC1 family protein
MSALKRNGLTIGLCALFFAAAAWPQTPSVVHWGSAGAAPSTEYNAVKSISAGRHTLALRRNGRVEAWGPNEYGQTAVPLNLANVVAVSAGMDHSLALKANGTVVAWGRNNSGQCDVPSGLTNAIAISAGGAHSLALRADGSVVAWGSNGLGQTTVPGSATGIVAIAAGGAHSLALKGNGTVVSWGSNSDGQTTQGWYRGRSAASQGLALCPDPSVMESEGPATASYMARTRWASSAS